MRIWRAGWLLTPRGGLRVPRGRDTEYGVKVKNLNATLRSLNKVNKDLGKEVKKGLRQIAKKVRTDARPLAPVVSGDLARSFKYSATNKGAAVTSSLPYAGWIEYGGTIQPQGVPITIKGRRPLGRAVDRDTADIEEQLGRLFDDLARRNGF